MILSNTLADFVVTQTWVNIVATIAAVGSTRTLVQNTGLSPMFVAVRASGGEPSDTSGLRLAPGEGIEVNAAQVWVRSAGTAGGKASLHTISG